MKSFFAKLYKSLIVLFIIVIGMIFFSSGCKDNKYHRVEISGLAQGTYYFIVYYNMDGKDYRHEIDSVLHDFDMSLSIYVPNSLISRINNGDTSVVVDKYIMDNLKISKEIYNQSEHALDITGLPLFEYWGFGNKHVDSTMIKAKYENPHLRDTINKLLQYVGFDKVIIDSVSNKVLFTTKNVELSFDAIAQGYSVGVISKLLESYGIENYCVDIGGEVYAKGTKPGGELWNVGIEQPTENKDSNRSVNEVLRVTNKAVVTSGNYRQYYIINGKRYSHTIDTRTGYPVDNNILSATVIHDDPAYADGWATAFMVLGLDKTKQIIRNHPEMKAYIIYTDDKGAYNIWRNDTVF